MYEYGGLLHAEMRTRRKPPTLILHGPQRTAYVNVLYQVNCDDYGVCIVDLMLITFRLCHTLGVTHSRLGIYHHPGVGWEGWLITTFFLVRHCRLSALRYHE